MEKQLVRNRERHIESVYMFVPVCVCVCDREAENSQMSGNKLDSRKISARILGAAD